MDQGRKKKGNKAKRNKELHGKFTAKAIRKVEERKHQSPASAPAPATAQSLKKKSRKDI